MVKPDQPDSSVVRRRGATPTRPKKWSGSKPLQVPAPPQKSLDDGPRSTRLVEGDARGRSRCSPDALTRRGTLIAGCGDDRRHTHTPHIRVRPAGENERIIESTGTPPSPRNRGGRCRRSPYSARRCLREHAVVASYEGSGARRHAALSCTASRAGGRVLRPGPRTTSKACRTPSCAVNCVGTARCGL